VNLDSEYDPKTYWETRLRDRPALNTVGYLGLGLAYNKWLYRIRKNVLERALRRFPIVSENMSLFEVAPGSGFYLPIWSSHGVRDLTAADITQAVVTHLGPLWPDFQFLQADIGAAAPPVSRQFDVVTAFDVLFHIVSEQPWRNAVNNLCSMVKPGGWLLISDFFLHAGEFGGYNINARTLEQYTQCISPSVVILSRWPIFVTMMPPVDSSGFERIVLDGVWRATERVLDAAERHSHLDVAGNLVGAVLYSLDTLLNRFYSEGPGIELMICRKMS
jgi:SAM-dependent methyltransferase